MIRIALYQPDIPQNTGAMMRLAACMGVGLDVIEPTAFPWDERKIRRGALDYIDHIDLTRHGDWTAFTKHYENKNRRIALMTTKGAIPYTAHKFHPDDILLAGSESSGVPDHVHSYADSRIIIPMRPGLRSLNVVNATAMILGEALRQTNNFFIE
ncbi:tRNA (cytidine(34)-2'-O)-methyltransferase [Micavibrio aeruginosavorus]|uniref:Putative tRNA (cytidine(34)-2'-O)-methyltransferase n=1 Tax=Micavibrio aeruginosavorus EPB TaxID=349215 RepID=M4VK06_9BACT|nr:tRNA (cytidine(34)-2'-O)-methyltransferase [Micavibrio aeruginosavorus]AGH98401.1 tRNA (cytosine34-2'-O-)-methyltransferase [Micavibrio aeruginosavorus EPB]